MRFQRNVKIFRGGVDAAPFAGLFFVVVMFMLMFYSHVFIPGVPIHLGDETEGAPEMTSRSVKVLDSGEISFLGRTLDFAGFRREIQTLSQKGTLPRRVLLEMEERAPRPLAEDVEDALEAAGVSIKYPGTRMDLPENAGFAGAGNPVVVVGMNLNGQIFFEHQLIARASLQHKLADMREKAGERLEMVLQVDAKTPAENITQICGVARRAGIKDVVIQTKPPV